MNRLWRWLRLSRLGYAVWRWRAVARYCWTGDCGCECGLATFRQIADGTPVDLFVPEAGCPIHDEASKLLPVLDFVKGAVWRWRGICARRRMPATRWKRRTGSSGRWRSRGKSDRQGNGSPLPLRRPCAGAVPGATVPADVAGTGGGDANGVGTGMS